MKDTPDADSNPDLLHIYFNFLSHNFYPFSFYRPKTADTAAAYIKQDAIPALQFLLVFFFPSAGTRPGRKKTK